MAITIKLQQLLLQSHGTLVGQLSTKNGINLQNTATVICGYIIDLYVISSCWLLSSIAYLRLKIYC